MSVEVTRISKDSFVLDVNGEEFFMSFKEYLWFETASLGSIFKVELLHGYHLRWPDLDVDLELDCLRHPERYPLRGNPAAGRKYAVVIEKGETNYGAYVPDLPGCVAVGDTIEETEQQIREAIEFHIQGMREDGLPIPAPTSIAKELVIYV